MPIYRRDVEDHEKTPNCRGCAALLRLGHNRGYPHSHDCRLRFNDLFETHLRSDESMMKKLIELKGQTLLCHCGARDMCHGDVLVKVFIEMLEPECASDGPTRGRRWHSVWWRGVALRRWLADRSGGGI